MVPRVLFLFGFIQAWPTARNTSIASAGLTVTVPRLPFALDQVDAGDCRASFLGNHKPHGRTLQ
jgi:hypothetical protein